MPFGLPVTLPVADPTSLRESACRLGLSLPLGGFVARAGGVGEPEEDRVADVLRDAHAFACRLALELSPELGREPDSRGSHLSIPTQRCSRGWTVGVP
jgi:hypothetical protein